MSTSMAHRRALLAALGVVGLAATLTPAAEAGRNLPPQRVIDPILGAAPLDLGVGPGGAAAIAFRGTTKVQNGLTDERLWVAVHEQGSLPTTALPRAFKLAEPVSPAGVPVADAEVGVDAAGNVTVAYAAGADVFVQAHPAGGTWGAPQRIGAYSSSTPLELVVAPNGRAILLTDAGIYDRAPAAAGFTAVAGTADVRHVAMNPAGNVAAVVLGPDNGDRTQAIGVRTRTADRPFGVAKPLGQQYMGAASDPGDHSAVVITDSGNVIVTSDGATTFPGNPSGTIQANTAISVRVPGSTFATATWTTEQTTHDAARPILATSTQASVRWNEDEPNFTQYDQLYPTPQVPRVLNGYRNTRPDVEAPSPSSRRIVGVQADYLGNKGIVSTLQFDRSSYEGPTPVIAPTGTETYDSPTVGLDNQGNGYIGWRRVYPAVGNTPAKYLIGISGYDQYAPTITGVTATPAKAGSPVTFSVAASDRMSAVGATWNFNGTTAYGQTVTHTFASPGTYKISVQVRDAAINDATWQKTVVVAP